jgi:hypothetical protein
LIQQRDKALDNATPDAINDLAGLGESEAQKKVHTDVVFQQFVNGSPAQTFRPLG